MPNPSELERAEFSGRASRVTATPPLRHRCTRGHEWADDHWGRTVQTLTLDIEGYGKGTFCLRCLLDFLKANAGTVEVLP